MNYGLLIERISELSGLPVSRVMTMDNNTLVNTVNDIFKEREEELTNRDGALYWINDWLNGSDTHEAHKPLPEDADMKLKDIDFWNEAALVDGSRPLNKLNDWLEKEGLYKIDGDTTYKEWNDYFNDVIMKKISSDKSITDSDYNKADAILTKLSTMKEREMTGEDALSFYSRMLSDEQKNDMTFKEAREALEKEIDSSLKQTEDNIKFLDLIVDNKKKQTLYQDRDSFLNSVVPNSSRLAALENKLTDEEKEKLNALKNDSGEITYGNLERFKNVVLNAKMAREIENKHKFVKAFNTINMKAPESWDEKFNSFDENIEHSNNENEEQNENTTTNTATNNNEHKSGIGKWLAGAAGVGTGIALSAVGGPVVTAVVTTAAVVKSSVNVVNWCMTKWNKHKKNFQIDEDGNVVVDAKGKPKPAPTYIDKVVDKTFEKHPGLKKTVDFITGNTKYEKWNWFVNGVSVGYLVGKYTGLGDSIRNMVTGSSHPAPVPNKTISTNNVTPQQPNVPQPASNTVDPGSHWNLSNLDTVYDSADMSSGPLKPLDGHYGDAVVRRVLDTPNGRMVDLASVNGEDLAWVAEEAVKTGIRK